MAVSYARITRTPSRMRAQFFAKSLQSKQAKKEKLNEQLNEQINEQPYSILPEINNENAA